jgi:hypothetical protein
MKHLTDKQVGYIAGIIDGEGSIRLARDRRSASLNPHVDAGNTPVALPAWLSQTTGLGTIDLERRGGNRRDLWRWSLNIDEMAPLLTAVRDNLIVKWEQATILLEFLATEWSRPLSVEQQVLRAIMFEDMAELNRKEKIRALELTGTAIATTRVIAGTGRPAAPRSRPR